MTENQRQKIIESLNSVQKIKQLNSNQIRILTNEFDQAIVAKIISNITVGTEKPFGGFEQVSSEDKKEAITYIRDAFLQEHCVGMDCDFTPTYDEDVPVYISEFEMLIDAGLEINDDAKTPELPQSPSDPEFTKLCKSLIEQRDYFVEGWEKMHEISELFHDKSPKARDTYQEILKQAQTIESKNKEIDSLKKQVNTLKTQLDEAQKMAAKVAKKSNNDEIIAALKSFLTISKGKRMEKREAAGDVVKKLIDRLGISDSELQELLDHIDDEAAQVVQNIAEQNNYSGNATHEDNRKQLNVSPTRLLPLDDDDKLSF